MYTALIPTLPCCWFQLNNNNNNNNFKVHPWCLWLLVTIMVMVTVMVTIVIMFTMATIDFINNGYHDCYGRHVYLINMVRFP